MISMTNEEAIKILKDPAFVGYNKWDWVQINESCMVALNIAIY